MKQKIAIIGYGAATIGFLSWLYRNMDDVSDVDIDIFDQNTQQNAGGLGGLAYDGKLVVNYSNIDTIDISPIEQMDIVDFFLPNGKPKSSASTEVLNSFHQSGMQLPKQDIYHIGTEQLRDVNDRILNSFKDKFKDRVRFNFNSKITYGSEQYNQIFNEYGKIIFAVGRYGSTLVKKVAQSMPGSVLQNSKVDIGVRFETLSNLPSIELMDKIFYEWKVRYKTKNNLMVRTFCHNPHGFVVVENVQVMGDNIAIANGHCKKQLKSQNTNFAILVTHKFTEPFDDSLLYGKILSQQANLLAGSNKKVILQTLGDFINKKRTKHLFRVSPTLPCDKYVMGDLTYALPAKTYDSILQFIDKLSTLVPDMAHPDNLLYGLQTKFYGTKMNNTDNVKFIGDCSGKTRSIVMAAGHGIQLAKQIFG